MSVASLSESVITVQRATITKDATGGRVKTWAAHLRLRARVQPLSGDEMIRHSKEEQRVTHKVYIANTPDVKAADRIQVQDGAGNSLLLYVQTVRDIDLLGRYVTVECEQRDA